MRLRIVMVLMRWFRLRRLVCLRMTLVGLGLLCLRWGCLALVGVGMLGWLVRWVAHPQHPWRA